MILDAFLNFLFWTVYVATYPIRALPDASLPAGLAEGMTNAMTYASKLGRFVPLGAFLASIGTVLTFEAGVITYKLVMWAVRRIPGQG